MDLEAKRLEALEIELRRDLEAVERVRKMMAFKNGALSSHSTDNSAQLEFADEEANLSDAPVTSLRSTIEAMINRDQVTRWTVQKVVAELKAMNIGLKAEKPVYSVGQAMKILAGRGKIRLVRRGSGSEPNIYKARSPEAKEGPSEQDSSETRD